MLINFEDEIKYREEIIQKACRNIKITPEERLWLLTHSLYNQQYGFPFYNIAIEELKPNIWHWVVVNIEYIGYSDRITPIIIAPGGKGKILSDFAVYDLKGNIKSGKAIKILSLELDKKHPKAQVKYQSILGLLGVEYECDYFDAKQNLHMRQASSASHDFAMKREVVNDHMIRYYCKSPIGDSFDALIFTVQWIECES